MSPYRLPHSSPRLASNLIIIFNPSRFEARDIAEITRVISRRAPDITIHVVHPRDTSGKIDAESWKHPTLTVSLAGRAGAFTPVRGPLLENRPLSKVEQYRRMLAAGLPMPRTALFRAGESYSEEEWGEFVILKPADLNETSHGRGVRLMRTRRLRDAALNPAAAPALRNTLVQSFIDSGQLPTIWRAMTLFGHTLYCMKSWSPLPRPQLDAPDEVIEAAIVEPKQPEIVAAYEVSAMRILMDDPEICAFARKVHETLPNYPLLGCDIIRDAGTGELSLIEMNAGGNVWHFSSKRASRGLAVITREQRINQFGAWDIAADVLIEKVRKLAS